MAVRTEVIIFDVSGFRRHGLTYTDIEASTISNRNISFGVTLNFPFHALAFRRFDIIHVNYGLYGMSAFLSNQFFGVPYLETVHGLPQPEIENGYDKLGYVAERWALPLTSGRASVVVSDSEYIQKELKSRFGIKSEVIPLGVDLERFHPPTKEKAAVVRRKLGIKDDDFVILFAGRFHSWKDPLTLLRAVNLLLQENGHIRVFFVGRGPMERNIKDLANSYGIAQNVTVVTDVDYYHGLKEYYLASDVFVLPTRKEGFGLVILEAMASGLPVVASDSGSAPELVGGSGLLFRTGDDESLSQKLMALIQDKELRGRIANEARARTVKLFSWEKCSSSYWRTYSRALGRKT